MPSLNTAMTNSQADNIGTDFAVATMTIYGGTIPANANAALSGNIAAVSHTLTGFNVATAGVITANAIATETILNTVNPVTFARLEQAGKIMQVTLGTGSAELIVSSLSYTAGEDSTVNSLIITQPDA